VGFLTTEHKILFFVFLSSLIVLLLSNHLLTLFLALESQVLSYLILLSSGRGLLILEGILKYFYVSALASALFLIIFWLILNSSGTLSLPLFHSSYLILLIPLFFFKFSLFPMHFFFPTLLEVSPLYLLPFWSAWSKLGVLLFFLKLFSSLPLILLTLSWLIGASGAVHQTRIVRVLAYSSINTMAWVLWGGILGFPLGTSFHVSFLLIYFITLFGIVYSSELLGFYSTMSVVMLGLTPALYSSILLILFLGLLGFPPLGGFLFKWSIISNSFMHGSYIIPLVALLISALAIYYVVRLISFFYFSQMGYRKILFQPLSPNTNTILSTLIVFLLFLLWFRLFTFIV
tara:strand:+ start:1676 stop:2710 length:1035 start_codon:yes stop_codon:yes gene_type:complete